MIDSKKQEYLISQIRKIKRLKEQYDEAYNQAKALNKERAINDDWIAAHGWKLTCLGYLLKAIDDIDI